MYSGKWRPVLTVAQEIHCESLHKVSIQWPRSTHSSKYLTSTRLRHYVATQVTEAISIFEELSMFPQTGICMSLLYRSSIWSSASLSCTVASSSSTDLTPATHPSRETAMKCPSLHCLPRISKNLHGCQQINVAFFGATEAQHHARCQHEQFNPFRILTPPTNELENTQGIRVQKFPNASKSWMKPWAPQLAFK